MDRSKTDTVYSRYCGLMEDDGICVDLVISRPANRHEWTLEVINTAGKSFVAEETYGSDDEAFSAFSSMVQERGMVYFHSFELMTIAFPHNMTLH